MTDSAGETRQRPERPAPGQERWQPLRAGLVDIFYYDREEFWFYDGRLLLRGNNGTGKSKVLALTLPFLLDAELAPHRVEPDADPKKRMEWNLLLGGDHRNPERLGYTWLEFGRRAPDGTEYFCTLGCGLKAVEGRGITKRWFFVSSQRVGADLDLVDATGVALPRERLGDALGSAGRLFDQARDYRRAVDEALFGLGEQRYGALVDLLVALRQPQLSKRPSEKALSAALTEALPPVDQAMISDVAEAFSSLETDRVDLEQMKAAQRAARTFLRGYRDYARTAARRWARRPRDAEGRHRRISDSLGEARRAQETAETTLTEAAATLAALAEDDLRLNARKQALEAGPEARSEAALKQAKREADQATERAKQLERGLSNQRTRYEGKLAEREKSTTDTTAARAELDGVRAELSKTARLVGIDTEHTAEVDPAMDDPLSASGELSVLRPRAEELVERRSRVIDSIRRLIAAADEAATRSRDRQQEFDAVAARVDELAEQRTGAEETISRAATGLVDAVREFLTGCTELRPSDPAAVLAALELWTETLDGPNPAVLAADLAHRARTGELTRDATGLEARQDELTGLIIELAAEITRLEQGEHSVPPRPRTRDSPNRTDRPGAPLWQLVDFQSTLPADQRAGLEAALEAADLLDAWVLPEGVLLDPDTEDVWLRADRPVSGPGLDTMLVPAEEASLPRATVAAVLATIGTTQAAGTWVTPDGRFSNGPRTGAWHKSAAEFIGRAAREAARRARLAELAELRELRTTELAEVRTALGTVRDRLSTLDTERSVLPDDRALRAAHNELVLLNRENARLTIDLTRARTAAAAARTAAAAARTTLETEAAEASLPDTGPGLSTVESDLADYRVRLRDLWSSCRLVADRIVAQQGLDRECAALKSDVDLTTEQAEEARGLLIETRERYRMLSDTVGDAVNALHRKLSEVTGRLADNADARTKAGHRRDRALVERGKAEGQQEELTVEQEAAAQDRVAAAEDLRRFTRTGLLAVALPELDTPEVDSPWAPDPTVRLARRMDTELADQAADDAAWERVQNTLSSGQKELTDALSRDGNRVSAEHGDHGTVVTIDFLGRGYTVPELEDALSTEIIDRSRLLNEREREVLENHLINEVAGNLQELIVAAENQVRRMNHELANRPTSTGMQLRLVWQVRSDGPAGLSAARERLLRQNPDAWSAADRTAVGEFLQGRIAEVRATGDGGGNWIEQLTAALDYRTWNQFVIQRRQNGQWRSATGPASGGERVLTVSVPLFAAASSHYASATNQHAPRLVTLDEAFAGVDDNARAKYLGLLAAFDLDVMMTSEREWGCYPEVPGLAICQLSRSENIPAVLVTNWKWNGKVRHRMLDAVPAAEEPVITDGLWA